MNKKFIKGEICYLNREMKVKCINPAGKLLIVTLPKYAEVEIVLLKSKSNGWYTVKEKNNCKFEVKPECLISTEEMDKILLQIQNKI